MDVLLRSRDVYSQIRPYQTRLIRLHGDRGSPDSPLTCDLYPADILNLAYEGLGIRSPADEDDYLVEYEALSYAWGNSENDAIILCNSVNFPVSPNLSEALRALRHSEEQIRYLWVDAICINQSDDREKSEQVWNMFLIYQKATRVIAWLGPAQEDLINVTAAASPDPWPQNKLDVWSILRGISYLYTRPWFQRIWVQQEIFAARKFTLQCGALSFEWAPLLSEPKMLLTLPHLEAYIKSKDKRRDKKESRAQDAGDILAQIDVISALDLLRVQNLNCFERFSTKGRGRPDFIETLLDTSILGATNRRDYVYGIIGIAGFPVKTMPFQKWMTARQRELFIPIDYSANLISLLCAVTWNILMKCGLTVLAKFQSLTRDDDETPEQTLPSWVIDWRLAGRLFSRKGSQRVLDDEVGSVKKTENAWEILVAADRFSARS